MNPRSAALVTGLVLLLPLTAGCQVASLVGGMAQNAEYQKKIEVLAEYTGLENRSTAVLIQADYDTLFQHPSLTVDLGMQISDRIAMNVPGAALARPDLIARWQYATPQWESMAYTEIAQKLGVQRLVIVDLYEYRLHPPGNRFEWNGACGASIGVVETDGYDPDTFAQMYNVSVEYPKKSGLALDALSQEHVETVLVNQFTQRVAWLFHDHIEPKYPDKYRSNLD